MFILVGNAKGSQYAYELYNQVDYLTQELQSEKKLNLELVNKLEVSKDKSMPLQEKVLE